MSIIPHVMWGIIICYSIVCDTSAHTHYVRSYTRTRNQPTKLRKKNDISKFSRRKIAVYCIFSGITPFVLAQEWGAPLKIEKRSFVFLRESLPKCPILPCCNFEVGRHSRLGVLEFTKNPMFPNFPITFCFFLIFSFLFAHRNLLNLLNL